MRFGHPCALIRAPRAGWLVVTLLAIAPNLGCRDFRFDGFLSQPIGIEMPNAMPVIEIGFGDQETTLAAIDSGSALTVVFRRGDGSRSEGELRIRETIPPERQAEVGKPVVTRFLVRDVEVYDLALQPVGLAPNQIELGGILGADVLSRVSVSLEYDAATDASTPRGSLTLRDEISGTGAELAEDCDLCDLLKEGGFGRQRCNAVVGARRRGGGEALIGGKERQIKASRLVLSICALPAAFDPTQPSTSQATTTGTPMAGLISTGLGVSVMARSAFERLQLQVPDLTAEPGHTLHLPYGEEPASLVEVERLAVVSSETDKLGPCGEIARRRRMLVDKIDSDDEGNAGAAIALAGDQADSVLFAVVADDSALFQGLRQELRPATPDVDVLLGGSFLRFFETALDYPAQRVILRCAEQTAGSVCKATPHCREGSTPPCTSSRGLSDQPCP